MALCCQRHERKFLFKKAFNTAGGDKLTLLLEFFLSCGPMEECRLTGSGSPGLESAELGARRIFGAIRVLSEIDFW